MVKLIMVSKPKSFRHKYLSKIISVIFKLKKSGQSNYEIAYYLEISKFFVTTILY